ncbi:TMEM165/GDT1 family protein [bacterium]|nr:TMEM165/GDT1 family protein [bacterium]
MDYKVLLAVFLALFISELGDKTQLATILFATDKDANKLVVFIGASLALIAASAIAVLAGSAISQYISERRLHFIAGIGFIGIGIWSLLRALKI